MNVLSRRWSLRVATVAGVLFLAARADADVTLDPTFGVNGITRTDFGSGYSDTPRGLVVQPDGKILTAGISSGGAGYFVAISRHSADGVLDSAGFGTDGKVFVHWVLRDYANDIDLTEDGKIVAAGQQATSNGVSTQVESVYRFNSDGTVDSTFADSGCVAIRPLSGSSEHGGVKALSDGRILAGGRQNGGTTAFHARRYRADGTLETGNMLNFGIDYNRGSCAFPDDGGIIMANLAALNGRREFVMARVDSAMNPVSGFGGNGIVQTGIEAVFNTVLRVLVLSNGKILLVGTTPGAGGGHQWTALRFLSDGTPDSLFGTSGRTDVPFRSGQSNECYDATVDADGRILLAGRAEVDVYGDGTGLARLLPDGSLDSTFSDDGMFAVRLPGMAGTHYFTRVLILPDGKLLTAGLDFGSNGGDFFLARFWPSDPAGVDAGEVLPARLSVYASPNPSHAGMTIRLQLPREQVVSVGIFDVAGREVRRVFDGTLPPGTRLVPWDGRDASGREAAAGAYFAKASSSGQMQVAKLIRVR